jgi:hypothetical protein
MPSARFSSGRRVARSLARPHTAQGPDSKIQSGAYQRRIVGITQGVMRHARLLNAKCSIAALERFLILISAGLYVIDELKVDTNGRSNPVQIVYDDILFHDPAVVVSPGYEDGVRTAPSPKILKNLGEAAPKAEALLVKTGEFLDLVVHSAEVDGLDIGLKFLRRNHFFVQFDGADLDDFTAQVDGKLIENGGF